MNQNRKSRTHCPSYDVFTKLNHQFTAATQQSRGKPFINIIAMMLKSMKHFEKLLKIHIQQNNDSFKDEYFCAIINCCREVSQQLKDKSDKMLGQPDLYNINDAQTSKLEKLFNDKIALFTDLGKDCSILFAQKIYNDTLKENVFAILFTVEYFDRKPEENQYIQSMISSLGKNFKKLKQWIEEPHFYWEFVKGIINIITTNYMESLLY